MSASGNRLPLVAFDGVDLAAGDRVVVRGLNWRLCRRESWLVTGPSGCGKTLLAHALRGTVHPHRGAIRYFGPDGVTWTPCPDETTLPRRSIVYAGTEQQRQWLGPDSFCQARWNSLAADAARTVAAALEPQALFCVSPFQVLGPSDVPPDFAERRRDAVARLQLEPLLERPVLQLSSGERRRLLLAQALARAPRLLILDDPFEGLDPGFRDRLRETLARLLREGDPQIVLIASRPEDAAGLGLRTMSLDSQGSAGEVPSQRSLPGRPRPPEPASAGAPAPQPPNAAPPAPEGRALPGNTPPRRVTRHRPVVRLRRVTIRYGGRAILDGIDWDVFPGENWLITGPNGSGKSTLLAVLLRDNPQAYSQEVTVLRRRSDAGVPWLVWRRPLGFVSPELLLSYPQETTCLGVVLSGFGDSIGLFRAPTAGQSRRARHMLETLGLASLALEPLGAVPEGAQRLLLLGRALVKSPRLLLLDEPCQGLDPDRREWVRSHVDRAAAGGVQVLYVTHHHEDRPRCTTHLLRLEAGRVVSAGPVTPAG